MGLQKMHWAIIGVIVLLTVVVLAVAVYVHPVGRQDGSDDWPPEVKAQVRASQASRAIVREQYPRLFEDLRECFFRHDPVGINFETNVDEYDPEVGTVIPRLAACTSQADVLDVIHEEFVHWFGADTAGARSRYSPVAIEVWAVWRRTEAQSPDESAAATSSEGNGRETE